MTADDGFAQTYAEARLKFLAAAASAALTVQSHMHPLRGRDGEPLALDVVREGPADRLLARPTEFRASALGLSARNCWVNWQKEILTEHDGLLSAEHPLIVQVLARPVSPSVPDGP